MKSSEYALGLRLAYSQYTDFNFYDSHPNSSYMSSRYQNLRGLTIDEVVSYSFKLNWFKINAQAGFAISVGSASVKRSNTHNWDT